MRVVVVGPGMAGLTAAHRLQRSGVSVVVVDKGRHPGGRLATRELSGGARADHGAQFFTVRTSELAAEGRLMPSSSLRLFPKRVLFWEKGWPSRPCPTSSRTDTGPSLLRMASSAR
jgi:phytoene dehydrogenase-like protein